MFVPVSFLYVSVATVAVSVNPTTASLSASQTQQFAATVTGDPNTSVTWSMNPNVRHNLQRWRLVHRAIERSGRLADDHCDRHQRGGYHEIGFRDIDANSSRQSAIAP